jgi:hypothetical protein
MHAASCQEISASAYVCAALETMSFARRPLAIGDPLPPCSLTLKLRRLLLGMRDKPGGC